MGPGTAGTSFHDRGLKVANRPWFWCFKHQCRLPKKSKTSTCWDLTTIEKPKVALKVSNHQKNVGYFGHRTLKQVNMGSTAWKIQGAQWCLLQTIKQRKYRYINHKPYGSYVNPNLAFTTWGTTLSMGAWISGNCNGCTKFFGWKNGIPTSWLRTSGKHITIGKSVGQWENHRKVFFYHFG